MSTEDKRQHTRLQIAIRAEVTGPDGFATGELRDISAGGAAVILTRTVGNVGSFVTLRVPYAAHSEMLAQGKVVRMEKTAEGFVYGLQFSEVKAEFVTIFMQLSDFSPNAEKPRQRKHPRIACRVPIRYGTELEKNGLLETISQGGVTLMVTTPFAENETTMVEIPHPAAASNLTAACKVIYQNPSLTVSGTFRVGLEFVDLDAEKTSQLEEIIQTVLKKNG